MASYIGAMSTTHGASSVRRDVDVLHSIFKSATVAELVQANPADGAERPKLPPFRPTLLQPDEVRRILRAFKQPQDRLVFLTVHLTGLRRFELLALRWRDVNLVEMTLRVADSKSEDGRRLIALPAVLVEALMAHYQRDTRFKGDDERVFCSSTGGAFGPDDYRHRFHKALEAAGVSKRPRPFHDERHEALTGMAANGASPVAIMATAGHASMQTTKKYLHLAGTVFQEDAEKLSVSLGHGPEKLSTELSTELSESQRISDDPNGSVSRLET